MEATTDEGPIQLWDAESAYLDSDLDFDYIAGVASDVARALATERVAEANYQPGDGTRYPLLFVPFLTVQARPRVMNGTTWSAVAVDGIDRDYGSVVLVWVGQGAYPIKLRDRSRDLAASYIEEHWGRVGFTSAVSIAVLLRAVAWHLDRLAAV